MNLQGLLGVGKSLGKRIVEIVDSDGRSRFSMEQQYEIIEAEVKTFSTSAKLKARGGWSGPGKLFNTIAECILHENYQENAQELFHEVVQEEGLWKLKKKD